MTLLASGRRRHEVVLQSLGAAADADASYTEPPTTLITLRAAIEPANQRQLERVTSGTIISEATHIVTIPFVSGVDTRTQVVFGARTFQVLSVVDPLEAHRELQLTCLEVVT